MNSNLGSFAKRKLNAIIDAYETLNGLEAGSEDYNNALKNLEEARSDASTTFDGIFKDDRSFLNRAYDAYLGQ